MISKFIMGVFDLLDAIPGWVWALVVTFLLLALAAANIQVSVAKQATRNAVQAHDKTKAEYAGFQTDVAQKQLLAVEKKRQIEIENFRNSEKVTYEQERRETVLTADVARLRGGNERMRNELEAFRAAAARDAGSGNLAGLAAKADTAAALYGACRDEYRSMAEDAERVRIQAVGLLEYIKGNSMCSVPFGPAAP